MSREAMKQALEALNEVTGWQWAGPMRVMDEVEDAITALRQALIEDQHSVNENSHALEQPADPVVGTKTWFEDGKMVTQELKHSEVYKQPAAQWVGLTDEEVQTCWDDSTNTIAPQYCIYRAIEAKLKEKNNG